MRLKLDATPEELKEKAPNLLKSLGEILEPVSPEMAEILEKALPRKESELKFPVLRELQKRTEVLYDQQLELMLKDISKVLNRSKTRKSLDEENDLEKAGPYIGPRGGKWADAAHTIPWKEEEQPTKEQRLAAMSKEQFKEAVKDGVSLHMHRGMSKEDKGHGPQWFATSKKTASRYAKNVGEDGIVKTKTVVMKKPYIASTVEMINVATGTVQKLKEQGYDGIVTQWSGGIPTKFNPNPEKEIWAVDFESMKKSLASPDYTEKIIDQEEDRYEIVKQELVSRGYQESDFEQGGPLHGYSTNELLEMIRDKRDD